MRFFIRTDASQQIGSGHIMRCLTLANELKQDITFICRDLPGNMCAYIEQEGYLVHRLAGTDWQTDIQQTSAIIAAENQLIDWLIVDHYSLDAQWETAMRPYVEKIMVIDDMANRKHDCDLLLDQNLYSDMASRYKNLVPPHCKQLLGPKYALLRPEFLSTRKTLKKRDGTIKRIFISMGGSDPTNETVNALDAIKLLNRPDIAVDVVVGESNPHKEHIKKICAKLLNAAYYCQVSNMAELMSKADLAIGAGGSTTWERCCLGLPSIVVILDKNQEELTNDIAKTQAIINLGWADRVSPVDYKKTVVNLSKLELINMSKTSTQLVDGKGVVKVTKTLL